MLSTITYLNILTILFILGYWIGIFLLLYHLIRFGIGTHTRRMALMITIISVILTILSIILLMNININF